MDLPIAQLEIATIAFAVTAILSYAANWWKPKDISQATILETPAWGTTPGGKQAYTQSLKLRLLSPMEAAESIKNIHDELPRVPNDFVWMEGDSPLILTIMAISSLGFGGLHCIAWYFQFPSQAELLCWRIASVISATLPAATLGINLIVHFLVTSYTDYKLVSTLLPQLDPLKEVHAGLWARMKSPSWNDWSFEAQRLIIRNPTGSRDWEKEPSKKMLAKYAPPEADATRYANYWNFQDDLKNFLDIWEKAQEVSPFEARTFQKAWFNQGSWMQADSKAELLVFWQEYEDFIKRDLKISLSDGHNTDCIAFILQAYNEAAKERLWWESFKKACDKASLILTIVSGVIYTAARLVILVLLFTCLRETPEGVYRVTLWLNSLPKFS